MFEGKERGKKAQVHLGGLAAGRLQGQSSKPKPFCPFFSFKLFLMAFPGCFCLLGAFFTGARQMAKEVRLGWSGQVTNKMFLVSCFLFLVSCFLFSFHVPCFCSLFLVFVSCFLFVFLAPVSCFLFLVNQFMCVQSFEAREEVFFFISSLGKRYVFVGLILDAAPRAFLRNCKTKLALFLCLKYRCDLYL